MTYLYLHGRKLTTIFELLGSDEDDIPYSLGWALSHSDGFLRALVGDLFPKTAVPPVASVRLQEYKDRGRTDIELQGASLHCIIEAKRGWTLPSKRQLIQYARRVSPSIEHRALVVMTECSPEYARPKLPRKVYGIPVLYRSWKDVALLTERRSSSGSHAERRLLGELGTYLRSLITMQNHLSNLVYVVSLSTSAPRGWKISYEDIALKKRRYFHPFGGSGGWPTEPPNYLAFRCYGRLQSIHHVESYEIVTEMHSHIPEIPAGDWGEYILYTLGKPIIPDHELRTGTGLHRAVRVEAMLDTLLTCKTITAAWKLTKRRMAEAGRNG